MNAIRFVWPERIAALAALLAALVMFLFWAFLAADAGSPLDVRLDHTAFYWSIEVEAMLVLPLWFVLRAIYFVKSYWSEWRTHRPRNRAKLWMARPFNRRRAHW